MSLVDNIDVHGYGELKTLPIVISDHFDKPNYGTGYDSQSLMLKNALEQKLIFAKPKLRSDQQSLQKTVTITETEVSDSESEDVSEQVSVTSSAYENATDSGVIKRAFRNSTSQWIEDPVNVQWRHLDGHVGKVLTELETLYNSWKTAEIKAFSPLTDALWLQTGRILREIGLPWHNNQINMPDEIDTSWPFHFKSFEAEVIRTKGCRVGDPNPSGYICNWGEANCYGIRALQQELREKCPDSKPVLIFDHMDREIIGSVEKLFGLETYHLDLDEKDHAHSLLDVTDNGSRPVIFAATLANTYGDYDNLNAICELSKVLPLILHIDASRSFDYITTLDDDTRCALGIEKLTLGIRSLDKSVRLDDGSVLASTIVAGGANYNSPASVVALKPLALGSPPPRVAYTRASDSTLAGSRDAIAPLWLALQEVRFGEAGFREIYQRCSRMRTALMQKLQSHNVMATAQPYSLDIIVRGCSVIQKKQLAQMGAVLDISNNVLLTIQPSVRSQDLERVIEALCTDECYAESKYILSEQQSPMKTYPVPHRVVQELEATIQSWKVATRSAAGYPFHMGSYSVLGPVIGHFLDLKIPEDWIEDRSREILTSRMKAFGLSSPHDQSNFKGAFTSGSTMGNRVGIHTALTHFPGAFLYFSSETHYSVPKTARDCDNLTNRWEGRARRYSEISCDATGSMIVDRLVDQVIIDRSECQEHDEEYRMVLFLNMGTTFIGARDNLAEIRRHLAEINVEISYIHMDGALDFGFDHCGISLGPPGTIEVDGVPAVQGVTLSHHKAMGNMVSGEVLCYSPGSELASLASNVDPRAIFETWLYLELYSPHDLANMFKYCQNNAARLERGLISLDVATKRNHESTITVFERPPAWITEEFSLRPEGDWVHFITMPHISPATVDLFLDRISSVDKHCKVAFSYLTPNLSATMGQSMSLQRVTCRHVLAERVAALAQRLTQPTWLCHQSINTAIKASLRGAMTVVACNSDGEVEVVFLAESTRERNIQVGPVLIRSQRAGLSRQIQDIARQLVGFMARHLHAQVQTDEMSYTMLYLE